MRESRLYGSVAGSRQGKPEARGRKEVLKLANGTQSVRQEKASPTGSTPSQQVRSEPACISVMKCSRPGVVSVQAVVWNPEIDVVVVERISSPPEGKESRRCSRGGRQQSFLALGRVRRDTTGVREQGIHAQGYLGNLGEPMASLPHVAGVRATGLSKGPGADV